RIDVELLQQFEPERGVDVGIVVVVAFDHVDRAGAQARVQFVRELLDSEPGELRLGGDDLGFEPSGGTDIDFAHGAVPPSFHPTIAGGGSEAAAAASTSRRK